MHVSLSYFIDNRTSSCKCARITCTGSAVTVKLKMRSPRRTRCSPCNSDKAHFFAFQIPIDRANSASYIQKPWPRQKTFRAAAASRSLNYRVITGLLVSSHEIIDNIPTRQNRPTLRRVSFTVSYPPRCGTPIRYRSSTW